ncbi:Hypoxanthine-guanine phosphoribosyltransferase [Halotydeus destructor]|nr:Hypoxanthine-guanine phosphoribosyltransferase [Halotydeus destructor]
MADANCMQAKPSPQVVIPDTYVGYPKESFCIASHYQDDIENVLIPGGLISDRIEKIACDIANEYGDQSFVALCVLKGGYQFFSDLLHKIRQYYRFSTIAESRSSLPNGGHSRRSVTPQQIRVEFIRVKSYEDDQSTGNVAITGLENLDSLRGTNVLIVEDIVDTGKTMVKLLEAFENVQPKTLRVASLFLKRNPASNGYVPQYVGFEVPDKFIIGYNLDYNEYFRELNHVCVINDEAKRKYSVRKSHGHGPPLLLVWATVALLANGWLVSCEPRKLSEQLAVYEHNSNDDNGRDELDDGDLYERRTQAEPSSSSSSSSSAVRKANAKGLNLDVDDYDHYRDSPSSSVHTTEDPLQSILPKVKFNCKGRAEGYYADTDFDCEVFHYCKTNGFRFTFICPPKSKFNQKQMTCDYDATTSMCDEIRKTGSEHGSRSALNTNSLDTFSGDKMGSVSRSGVKFTTVSELGHPVTPSYYEGKTTLRREGTTEAPIVMSTERTSVEKLSAILSKLDADTKETAKADPANDKKIDDKGVYLFKGTSISDRYVSAHKPTVRVTTPISLYYNKDTVEIVSTTMLTTPKPTPRNDDNSFKPSSFGSRRVPGPLLTTPSTTTADIVTDDYYDEPFQPITKAPVYNPSSSTTMSPVAWNHHLMFSQFQPSPTSGLVSAIGGNRQHFQASVTTTTGSPVSPSPSRLNQQFDHVFSRPINDSFNPFESEAIIEQPSGSGQEKHLTSEPVNNDQSPASLVNDHYSPANIQSPFSFEAPSIDQSPFTPIQMPPIGQSLDGVTHGQLHDQVQGQVKGGFGQGSNKHQLADSHNGHGQSHIDSPIITQQYVNSVNHAHNRNAVNQGQVQSHVTKQPIAHGQGHGQQQSGQPAEYNLLSQYNQHAQMQQFAPSSDYDLPPAGPMNNYHQVNQLNNINPVGQQQHPAIVGLQKQQQRPPKQKHHYQGKPGNGFQLAPLEGDDEQFKQQFGAQQQFNANGDPGNVYGMPRHHSKEQGMHQQLPVNPYRSTDFPMALNPTHNPLSPGPMMQDFGGLYNKQFNGQRPVPQLPHGLKFPLVSPTFPKLIPELTSWLNKPRQVFTNSIMAASSQINLPSFADPPADFGGQLTLNGPPRKTFFSQLRKVFQGSAPAASMVKPISVYHPSANPYHNNEPGHFQGFANQAGPSTGYAFNSRLPMLAAASNSSVRFAAPPLNMNPVPTFRTTMSSQINPTLMAPTFTPFTSTSNYNVSRVHGSESASKPAWAQPGQVSPFGRNRPFGHQPAPMTHQQPPRQHGARGHQVNPQRFEANNQDKWAAGRRHGQARFALYY